MSGTVSIKKIKKTVIKKPRKNVKKKIIENRLNSLTLFNDELTYDLSVDDEYKSSILERDMTVHYDKIKQLPTYNITFKTKTDDNEIVEKKMKHVEEEVDDESKMLPIEKVGNIYYKFDYDKGIIYDMKMNEVGHIDDYGEICIINDKKYGDDNEEEDIEDEREE